MILPNRTAMLSLQSQTSERWLNQVDQHLDQILIDHAHCEKKAAGTAMNLISAYVDREDLTNEMVDIVNEELEHFKLVLELLKSRSIRFRRMRACNYGRQLNDLVSKLEPQRAVDRLLVAGLIEARSCERFDLLSKHVADTELSNSLTPWLAIFALAKIGLPSVMVDALRSGHVPPVIRLLTANVQDDELFGDFWLGQFGRFDQ